MGEFKISDLFSLKLSCAAIENFRFQLLPICAKFLGKFLENINCSTYSIDDSKTLYCSLYIYIIWLICVKFWWCLETNCIKNLGST